MKDIFIFVAGCLVGGGLVGFLWRWVGEKQAHLAMAFKSLSSDALQNNNQAFLHLAEQNLQKFQQKAELNLGAREKAIGDLTKPIFDSLSKVDDKLAALERARIAAYAALDQQLKTLVEVDLPALKGETTKLVKALQKPTVRGRWGEIQLRRSVELAGMLEHCDFFEQHNVQTETSRLRPDLVVKLPAKKIIVVDAKAPLSAYLEAVEATDEKVRLERLTDHARQVKDHIIALSRKAYHQHLDKAPEFVVMFLPAEAFFSAALEQDPTLIEFGVQNGVIPATPTTLIALLLAVAHGWKQESMAQNAEDIAKLGKELFERIGTMTDHFGVVGDKLGQAVVAYNKTVSSLEARVLVSARKFSELKVAAHDSELDKPKLIEHIVVAAAPSCQAAGV
jgi:DNA recombination protein RmuC